MRLFSDLEMVVRLSFLLQGVNQDSSYAIARMMILRTLEGFLGVLYAIDCSPDKLPYFMFRVIVST